MNNTFLWVIGAVVVVVVGGGFLVFNATGGTAGDDAMVKEESGIMQKDDTTTDDSMMEKDDSATDPSADGAGAMMEKGSYEAYAPEKLTLAENGKVVLYFHADWCPICRPLDAAFKASGVPSGVHVLKVNYDTATDLKRKYGVTYQHTFVQVDAKGNLISKWGDAFTAADVFAKIQ